MKRVIFYIAMLNSPGCMFDEKRLTDLRYPAVLNVVNHTGTNVLITSIYSKPIQDDAFILSEFSLKPYASFKIPISEPAFKVIKSGQIHVDFQCIAKEHPDGGANEYIVIPEKEFGKVTIAIASC